MPEPRSRSRVVGILGEIASIVFAVLVALAIDQWWGEQENARLAVEAGEAIANEIRQNRAELLGEASGSSLVDPGGEEPDPGRAGAPASPGDVPNPDRVLAALDSAIAAYRADSEPATISVNWDVALLSSAAWETAQLTRTAHYMELDRVVDLARLYELQRFYSERQDRLVEAIADLQSGMESDPVQSLLLLRSRYAVSADLRRTLATVYACRLADLQGDDAVEPGACPRNTSPDGG